MAHETSGRVPARSQGWKLGLAAAVIAGLLVYLWSRGQFDVLASIRASDVLAFVLLTLLSCYLIGLQTSYLMSVMTGRTLTLADRLLLPLGMALWGYVIPANGGTIYSLFVLKQKYAVEVVHTTAMAVYTVYLSLILTGIAGIALCVQGGQLRSTLMLASVALVASPVLVSTALAITRRLSLPERGLGGRVSRFLRTFALSLGTLLGDWKVALVNTLVYMLGVGLSAACYGWAVQALKWQVTPGQLLMFVLVTRVSSLTRILPGNVGVEEMVSGALFAAFDQRPENGVLLALLFRMVGLLVIIPGGVIHTVHSMHAFKVHDLRSFLARMRSASSKPEASGP